jgi:hypothetical protein
MVETTATTAQRRCRRPSLWARFRGLFIVLLVLGALVGWYWWHRPQPLRLVGTYPCLVGSDTLIPLTTGFLSFLHERTIVLRGWDGRERWRVELPPDTGHWGPSPPEFGMSPDGRRCATLEPLIGAARVRLYREGTLYATQTLPLGMRFAREHEANLKVCNDGRAFLTVSMPSDDIAFILRDMTLLGRGHLPRGSIFTPDGTVAVSQWSGAQMAPITIKDGRITLGAPVSLTGEIALDEYAYDGSEIFPALYAPHTVIARDGTVTPLAGKPVKKFGKGWACSGTISPSSRYTAFERDGVSWMVNPTTGKGWKAKWGTSINSYDVTDDGRFVLLNKGTEVPPVVESLCEQMHVTLPSRSWLMIYERPGTLRAAIREGDEISSWWISPDGHALVLMEGNTRIRLLRW